MSFNMIGLQVDQVEAIAKLLNACANALERLSADANQHLVADELHNASLTIAMIAQRLAETVLEIKQAKIIPN